MAANRITRHPFLSGVVLILVLEAVGAGIFLWIVISGGFPMNADVQPGALEHWVGQNSRNAWEKNNAPKQQDPVPVNGQTLMRGARIYQANCAICHGGANYRMSPLHKGAYPGAPQFLVKGGPGDPPAVVFYTIKHGIRFTAMPAWKYNLSDLDIWSVTNFTRQIGKLPPQVQQAWEQMPSPIPAQPSAAH